MIPVVPMFLFSSITGSWSWQQETFYLKRYKYRLLVIAPRCKTDGISACIAEETKVSINEGEQVDRIRLVYKIVLLIRWVVDGSIDRYSDYHIVQTLNFPFQ